MYFVYPHKIIDKYVGYDSGEDVDPSGAISYDTREILYERNQNHDMRLIFGDELSEEELEAKIKEREEQGFNEATKIFNQFLS